MKNAALAVYASHEEAEAAIKELHGLGYDMDRLSIIGKGFYTQEQAIGFINTGDRVKVWSKHGAIWGSLGGLLLGSGLLIIPGLGPLVVLGPLASWIAGGALGSSLSALGAALYSIGIPRDSVIRFERAVKAEKYLVLATGTQAEIDEAMGILKTSAELAEAHQNLETPPKGL